MKRRRWAPSTFDIWIDGNNLLRRESVTLGGGIERRRHANISMTFQDFGTPVSIEAPAPGSVVSLSQFLNDVRSSGGQADHLSATPVRRLRATAGQVLGVIV